MLIRKERKRRRGANEPLINGLQKQSEFFPTWLDFSSPLNQSHQQETMEKRAGCKTENKRIIKKKVSATFKFHTRLKQTIKSYIHITPSSDSENLAHTLSPSMKRKKHYRATAMPPPCNHTIPIPPRHGVCGVVVPAARECWFGSPRRLRAARRPGGACRYLVAGGSVAAQRCIRVTSWPSRCEGSDKSTFIVRPRRNASMLSTWGDWLCPWVEAVHMCMCVCVCVCFVAACHQLLFRWRYLVYFFYPLTFCLASLQRQHSFQ